MPLHVRSSVGAGPKFVAARKLPFPLFLLGGIPVIEHE